MISRAGGIVMTCHYCFYESESQWNHSFSRGSGWSGKKFQISLLFCMFLSLGECISEQKRERQNIQAANLYLSKGPKSEWKQILKRRQGFMRKVTVTKSGFALFNRLLVTSCSFIVNFEKGKCVHWILLTNWICKQKLLHTPSAFPFSFASFPCVPLPVLALSVDSH